MKKSATILNGAALADKIKLKLKNDIADSPKKPGLAAILVGDDAASALYVKLKEKASIEVGINFHKYLCDHECYPNISEAELIKLIKFLNKDKDTDGIIVQLPLPEKFDAKKIITLIDPKKDVDGFHPKNKNKEIIPPTIAAILELLKATDQNLAEKNALIIGQSDIFIGRLEKYLKKIGIKKIKNSREIPADSKNYDIVIIALGKPKILKKFMVKDDAIVIDVGISRVKGKTVGDVDPSVAEAAGFISPVPGGVGPLTVAYLLKNTYSASKNSKI